MIRRMEARISSIDVLVPLQAETLRTPNFGPPAEIPISHASVPVPKFASFCGTSFLRTRIEGH